MSAATAKQEALSAIERLPDSADMEQIMYRLYVLENIRRGQQDAEAGKSVGLEEARVQWREHDAHTDGIRVALIEGEQRGPARPFDPAAFRQRMLSDG